MIASTPPVPERNVVLTFPTPLGRGDLVFSEVRDQRLPKNQHWEYGEAHPNTALYPDHELVYVVAQSENPGWSKWYYAARRESQNLYNWTFSDADTWPTLTQTFVVKDSEFDPDSPIYTTITDGGGFMHLEVDQTLYPVPPAADVDMTGYSAISTTRKDIADRELASLYCEVVIVYEKIDEPICGIELDEETGTARQFCQTKVLAGTAGSGVSGGDYTEVRPLNTLWSMSTTRRAAGMAGSPGTVYSTPIIVDYYWPAVLDSIKQTPWLKKDGTSQIFTFPVYAREAYNGPCLALKEEQWTSAAPTLVQPEVLDPMPIVYKGPNVQFSIPACLHSNYTFQEVVGTADPVWVAGTFTHTFPATSQTDWPVSIVASFSTRRMYGGFLRQKITVFRPV